MSEWQDISTAPRDGTTIDLWHSEYGRYPAHFWGLPEHSCGEDGRYCDSDWHRMAEGWVDSAFNEIMLDAEDFTHWMPLPQPPNPHSEKVE